MSSTKFVFHVHVEGFLEAGLVEEFLNKNSIKFNWAVKTADPIGSSTKEKVKSASEIKVKKKRRKPLSPKEVTKIIHAIEEDPFTPLKKMPAKLGINTSPKAIQNLLTRMGIKRRDLQKLKRQKALDNAKLIKIGSNGSESSPRSTA